MKEARVHRVGWQGSGGMASHDMCAAAGDAGDWIQNVRFRVHPSTCVLGGSAPDASNRLRPSVPTCYDRRQHPWEGLPR